MRERKFRAWDKAIEAFIYSEFYPSMWQFFKELHKRGIRHYEAEDYTGLRDSKGTEIYEEDIVRCKYGRNGTQDLVVREMTVYGLFFNGIGHQRSYFYWNLSQRDTMKVIGNTHEGIREVQDITGS